MKKKVKFALWGVAAVALVAFAAYSKVQPLETGLLEVTSRSIEKKFTESGAVSAHWQQSFYSVLGGKVQSVSVEEGEQVLAGDILLELDTSELSYQIAHLQGQYTSLVGQERQVFSGPHDAQVAQQQLAVKQAESQLAAARAEADRIKVLHEAGAVSRSSLDEANRAVTQLEILLAQQEEALRLLAGKPPAGTREQFAGQQAALKAQIALLEYQKNHAVIKAPADSTVAVVHVKEGAVVAPGMPLLSLFRPGRYQVEVFLLPEDVAGIEPGMSVRAVYKGQAGDIAYTGRVEKVAPTAVERMSALGLIEQRVKVTVELTGNTPGLRPGYSLDVEFITLREENRLVVPKTALFSYEGKSAVWVSRNGRAVIQQVEKGLETDDEVVITSGLSQGDLVIRNPRVEGLKEGKRIASP